MGMSKAIVCIVALLSCVSINKAHGQNPMILDRLWAVVEFKSNDPVDDMQSRYFNMFMNSENGYTTYFFTADTVVVDVRTYKVMRNPIKWNDDYSYTVLSDSASTSFFFEMIDDHTLILTSNKYTYSQKLESEKPKE